MSRSLSKQKTSSTYLPRLKVMIPFTSQHIQNIFLKEMCQKSNMDTAIDFVKT